MSQPRKPRQQRVPSPQRAHQDQQLQLDGIGTVHPLVASGSLDPRFILSDETCRIGKKYLAEMRRLLAASTQASAA